MLAAMPWLQSRQLSTAATPSRRGSKTSTIGLQSPCHAIACFACQKGTREALWSASPEIWVQTEVTPAAALLLICFCPRLNKPGVEGSKQCVVVALLGQALENPLGALGTDHCGQRRLAAMKVSARTVPWAAEKTTAGPMSKPVIERLAATMKAPSGDQRHFRSPVPWTCVSANSRVLMVLLPVESLICSTCRSLYHDIDRGISAMMPHCEGSIRALPAIKGSRPGFDSPLRSPGG